MDAKGFAMALFVVGIVAARGSDARAQVTPAVAPCSYYVALTGSNRAPGTQSSPLRTIQHGVDALASAGGTVCVADAGPYVESVTLRNSGTASRWIAIRGVGTARAEISPPSNGTFAININARSYVALEHLHTNGGELGIVSSGGGSHWYVHDSEIENAVGSGIQLNNGDYVTVEGNLVHHNAATWASYGSGVSVYEPVQLDSSAGYHIYIGGNTIYSNSNAVGGTDGNGIILDTFSGHRFSAPSLVENNIGYGNAGACVKVYANGGAPILVRNNTCFKDQQLASRYTWRGEVSLEYAGDVTTVNNILWFDPAADSSNSAYLDGAGSANLAVSNISYGGSGATNPLLVNPPADMSLQPGSPAIGTGTNAYGVPAVDITGAARSPASVDIGAVAFRAASPTATSSIKASATPISTSTAVATPTATPTTTPTNSMGGPARRRRHR